MQTYSLARLSAGKTRRASVTLPPILDSVGAQKEYLRTLRAMLRDLGAFTRVAVLPSVEDEIARQRASMATDAITWDEATQTASVRPDFAHRKMVADAWGANLFQGLIDLAVRLGLIAEQTVGRILNLEAGRHTEKWKASVRSTIGIDIAAVVTQEDLADYLQTAAARNASLIKNLATDVVTRVERASYDAILQGKTVKELRSELTKQFGIADGRAKVIARTEIAKLNSDMNRRRHEQAGITLYRWRTSSDERVRERHKRLEGKEYKYGEPTGAEQGLPPGQPIQCRCIAQAIVIIDGERFN